jgi:hypothetical protein
MSSRKILSSSKGLYQVWATSYPLNGADESSKYDPGYYLIGQFDDIYKAVKCYEDNKTYEPLMTKFVTWKTEITDVSESVFEPQAKEQPDHAE